MLANDILTKEDEQFMIDCRRTIHSWPEGGFDLPETLKFIKSELDKAGVPYTDSYGLSSLTAYINKDLVSEDGSRPFTIAVRADMDALPVKECTGLPFASRREGVMHACGHDAHTAMLMGLAKVLKRLEGSLACRVKLLFQASEESAFDKRSGAKMMCDDGVLDDVDVVLGCHVDPHYDTGILGIHVGPCSSNSNPITIEFSGRSSHATHPEGGADALAMAVKFINDYQYVLTRQVSPAEVVASSVCSLHTSSDNFNVVSDRAVIKMTLRTFSDETNDFIEGKIRTLANNSAKEMGGSAKVDAKINYPAMFNDAKVCAAMHKSHAKVVGEENAIEAELDITSEDFSYFSRIRPSCYFRLGIRNEKIGSFKALHANDFMVDEAAMAIGAKAYIQFILDNQNGLV